MQPMTIREATYADRSALIELAQLDSAAVPDGRLLLAEQDGELRAAFAVTGGEVIADPFHRTAELIPLLRLRAGQLRKARTRALRLVARSPGRAPARPVSRVAA
ncbi:MAG: hypothetical protein ACRDKX_06995 [Solirubrobacterales bacterium]